MVHQILFVYDVNSEISGVSLHCLNDSLTFPQVFA